MKSLFLAFALLLPLGVYADEAYTVIANPGEDASTSIRLNWHTDLDSRLNTCYYTTVADTGWTDTREVAVAPTICTVFDSVFSHTPDTQDVYENARFLRHAAEIKGLKPDTKYMYRIGKGDVRYFKTAPVKAEWTAAIISDFHAYLPLSGRVTAAMAMLDTLEVKNMGEFDMVLHAGDIAAWGGSYSCWKDLYAQRHFNKYMWAGVIGNHDYMSRKHLKDTNEYFRCVNNNPANGYEGEEGVCYHFTYGDVLFVMLSSESMRKQEGLEAAQKWVREVIKANPAKYVVAVEHYEWFHGNNGKTGQYARWKQIFDECGVDLAISGNNHVYARTNSLYADAETDGSKGTVYLTTSSSDNGRGRDLEEMIANQDVIKCRWTEGAHTVSAMIMNVDEQNLTLTLYDRYGKVADNFTVKAKARPYEVKAALPDGFDGTVAVLRDYDTGDTISTVVAENNTIVFKGEVTDPTLVRLYLGGDPFKQFILEGGNIDLNSLSSISPLNDKLQVVYADVNRVEREFQQSTDEATQQAVYNKMMDRIEYHLKQNLSNPIGYFCFLQLAYSKKPNELAAFIDKYPQFKDSARVKTLIEQNQRLSATSEGAKYIDFEVDGKKLSDYVGKDGKYLLVDFWASWCGPCIREIPVIKELWAQYKDKLNVLGVAVWDRVEATHFAIAKHKIEWDCIINAQKIPTDIYGISGIPCIILISPDGTILSRGKQGQDLQNDVAKYLGGK